MQIVPQQAMGYDRAITVFSPDGRLLQVEYAKKAVSQGAMAIGIVCKDAVLLVADRRLTDPLVVKDSVKKIYKVDDHIIATAAGYLSDARVLVKRCRVHAQQHRLTYGEEIDVESLIIYVADYEQAYTQYGGIRPFGISFLLAGIDSKGPALFMSEPSGTYFKYKAKALGMGSTDANKMLKAKYKENMTVEQALKLAYEVFKKVLGKDFNIERLEASQVTASGIKKLNGKKGAMK